MTSNEKCKTCNLSNLSATPDDKYMCPCEHCAEDDCDDCCGADGSGCTCEVTK